MTAKRKDSQLLDIPTLTEPLSIELPPGLEALREKALSLHCGPMPGTAHGFHPGLPDIPLADARAWAEHADDEDWLVWRARRCAERLRSMKIEMEPGELIVGKPAFRDPTDEERTQIEEARAILSAIPPFPGGDAGHFHPDYETLFERGVQGILDDIRARRNAQGVSAEQRTFYDACQIAMEGFSLFIQRTADACLVMADTDTDDATAWRGLSDICNRVSRSAPTTFHEAIQLMFLAEIALWFGEDHTLACPGRMDRTLIHFYKADVREGLITPRRAFELICCLYIHLNRILWPGSAVAVMVGGRDAQGRDVTNDLTYLCLAARQATQLVYPTVGLAWHPDTPEELTNFAMRMLSTGVGDPAFFNDDLIAAGLAAHGVRPEDRHNYMNSTCVEIKVCGRSNMWVTAPYFNCPQSLLDEMARVAAGDAPEPGSFDEFVERVYRDLAAKIADAARQLDKVWTARAERGGFPLASCLVRDCLERGRDFDRGGARYNWVENSFVGLANLVDSLLAVKYLVYEHRDLSLAEFYRVLEADFSGHEALRQRIIHALPRYGNDDDRADELATSCAEFLIQSTESNTVGPHRYVPGFFCWIQHERMGSQTGATPDGRCAGQPLADGAGAAQGRENRGPTAAVLSTTKWRHVKVLGGLVHNIKFSRRLLEAEPSRRAARKVIETYLARGGFEIQVNVVGKETLLDAQEHPDRHRDLLVRVAGYSDYFVHLNRNMQNEVIARTEHVL